jgi:hypothetical protein
MTPDCVYWQTTPLDVDPATFVVVGEGYGCDARSVYYHWEQIG